MIRLFPVPLMSRYIKIEDGENSGMLSEAANCLKAAYRPWLKADICDLQKMDGSGAYSGGKIRRTGRFMGKAERHGDLTVLKSDSAEKNAKTGIILNWRGVSSPP